MRRLATGHGRLNSVTTPAGVIRAIRLPRYSVNHRLPSGPAVMPKGSVSNENPGVTPPVNSVTTPAGVTRPIRPGLATSVNQRLPSGPSAISRGKPLAEKSVPPVATVLTSPAVVIFATRPGLACSTNHRSPSGPTVIPAGLRFAGSGNSVT